MFTAKHWISRFVAPVAAVLLALNLPAAHAVLIDATTTFDTASSFGPTNGSFSLTSGGVPNTSTFSGSGITSGSNPLSGPLTNIFDGTGFAGSASETTISATTDPSITIGFDTSITVVNNTGSTETVKFRLDFSNMVNADGNDSFSDSELTLNHKLPGDIDFSEIFFSQLISDTSFGDVAGGVPTGLFGESLTDSGSQIFTYMLAPGEQVDLAMSWTLFGGVYHPDGGLAEANLRADLTVVPLPGSLLFMLSGMLLLPLQRLLRK